MTKILIGLLILSLMVFIHELGHFIAARLCGVIVESFSIGWGPVLFKVKKGTTEYRISAVPIGGYCGMKGETAFKKALDENLNEIPKEEGSLFRTHPLKRIIIAFAGPFANYLTAALALMIVSALGSVYYTQSNRIAPVYYYNEKDDSPAKKAGLRMGDRIISINGIKTNTFSDILKEVIPSAKESLTLQIERNGEIISKELTPKLDPATGAGIIGFYSFIPLDIKNVKAGSAAAQAEIKKGDRIIAVNGKPVINSIDLQNTLETLNEKTADLTLLRNGTELTKKIALIKTDLGFDLGLELDIIRVEVKGTGFFKSIAQGFILANKNLILTLKGLTLLFKGVDLKQAVSGPLRITHLLGDAAERGFKENLRTGLSELLTFISIISISLFIMNLLPIPIADGGLILFAIAEWILKRQIKPKILYYMQFIGFTLISAILLFAIWGDISFFLKK